MVAPFLGFWDVFARYVQRSVKLWAPTLFETAGPLTTGVDVPVSRDELSIAEDAGELGRAVT